MPFNKAVLAAMTAETGVFVTKAQIAKRLEVSQRTVERLIYVHGQKITQAHIRNCRKILYCWPSVLEYAKIYAGVYRESASLAEKLQAQRFAKLDQRVSVVSNATGHLAEQLGRLLETVTELSTRTTSAIQQLAEPTEYGGGCHDDYEPSEYILNMLADNP